jgi:hypothetical protein
LFKLTSSFTHFHHHHY